MRNNLSTIIFTMTLVKYLIQKSNQNSTIYFAYNSIAISLSTDLLYNGTNFFVLTSALTAIGWITRYLLVIGTSLFIKEIKLKFQLKEKR